MALEAGKGSKQRPYLIDQDTYSNNWEAIFGKKEQPKELPKEQDEPKKPVDE